MAEFIRMPSLSPTMEEGVIQSIEVKVGDRLESGAVLANIETDKAIVEYEIISEGYLRHLFIKAGDKVPVGKPIGILSEEQDEDLGDLVQAGQQEFNSGGSSSADTSSESASSGFASASTEAPAASTQAQQSNSAPSDTDYDVAVIGAGPGGYVAAIRAAQLGLKTALIDKRWLGGVCLNVGCIPSKSLLKNAEVIHTLQHRGKEFGFSFENLQVDFSQAVKRSRKAADKLTKGIAYLCKKNNIDVHMGKAEFQDAHTVSITDSEGKTSKLTAKNFIISTGAQSRPIPGVEIDGKKVLTYTEAILQEHCPKKVVVVGSGAIGVEFATIWNAYGTEIDIVEMLPRLVPLEDEEVSGELQKAFKKRGIRAHLETKVESIKVVGDEVEVEVSNKEGRTTIKAEQVLVAIGFIPNVEGIGLETVGVKTERGRIVIDEAMRTSVSNIFAIGDVTGKLMLAHVASAMGIIAAETIANHETITLNYEMMPRATYCHPQVASFGITEAQAKERGYEVKVAKFPYSANGKALGLGEGEGFVKIVTEAKYGEILGAHLIGPEVTELLPEFTLAQATELTIEEIARNVHAHPTLSEAIMEAAHGVHGDYIHI